MARILSITERLVRGETSEGIKVTMPVQIAEVKRVLMSVHRMNQAGLIVILDGPRSYFQEKATGKITKLKYEGGTITLTSGRKHRR